MLFSTQVLDTIRDAYGAAVVSEFSARAKAYAGGSSSADAYVAYMRGVFGSDKARKLVPHLVRLLPDAARAAELEAADRAARAAFG